MREALLTLGINVRDTHVEQVDVGAAQGEFTLRLKCNGGQSPEYFLFKIFNRKVTKQISRTAALIASYPGATAVKLIAVIERDGFAAHLYEWSESAKLLEDACAINACREQAFIDSCAWSLPAALFAGHRSAGLAERCGELLWARCKAFSRWLDADIRQLVDAFAANPLRLQRALGELPLRLYNPDIALGNTYALEGSLKVLRWENWTVEPIGSGWPLELGWERLGQAFPKPVSAVQTKN